MHGTYPDTTSNWIEQSLDGVDVLRDSIRGGYLIAAKMRDEGGKIDDEIMIAGADLIAAFAAYFQNDLQEAVASFSRLVTFFSERHQPDGVFFANTGLVIAFRKLGDVGAAHELAEKKLHPQLEFVPPRLTILALNIIAIVCQERGETVQAIRYFYRALDESRKINSASRIAQITANLGEVLYVTGNPLDAEEFLQLACDVAPSSLEKWLLPFSSTMLALCKIALGKFDEAYSVIAPYIESEDINAVHINSYRSFYLSVAAYTLAMRGHLQEAADFSEKALTTIDAIEDPHLKPYIWWVRGYLHRQFGQYDQAIAQLRHAIDE